MREVASRGGSRLKGKSVGGRRSRSVAGATAETMEDRVRRSSRKGRRRWVDERIPEDSQEPSS